MSKKVCICTTLWSSINNWIVPFLNEYHQRGVEVTIVCNMDEAFENSLKERFPFVHTHKINFPRGMNALGSIKSIWALYKFLKKGKFDLVQYSTPNASMYGAIASRLAHVPARLYCQWGMVYVTMSGLKRKVFESIERVVCRFSTHVQPDSYGNLNFCREQGLYDDKKSCVIWNGSAKGLDLTAFDISKKSLYAEEIKDKYNIPADVPVVGFVGRLGREKGCHELLRAFQNVKKEFPSAKLLFVGPIEKKETMDPEILDYFETCDDVIKTDRVSNVEKYTSAMDVYVLPSYREGFGMGVVEASAMGVPVVVTQYPGPSSAMEEGVSGYSVPVKDVELLTKYILDFLRNPEEAQRIGRQGRKWVEDRFDQKIFIEKYMENRMQILRNCERR